jgi:catechol 2,3-dioxygenase-like lactoylglutathione lyase family enzyme
MTVFTRQGNGDLPIMTIGSGPQFVALSQIPSGTPARGGVGHHFSVHIENFEPAPVVRALAELGVTARVNMRPAAAQRPTGAPSQDTPELLFSDPDGLLLQIQDVRYCGGVGPLGELCGIPQPTTQPRDAPFAVRTLNHVSIGVSNVQRSLEFYQRVFGYTVKTSQSQGAVPILTIGAGPQFVGLREGRTSGHHLCLGIERFDPDQVMQTLAEHRVQGRLRIRPAADQRPPGPAGADTPEITFDDPDGFSVQIQDVSYCGGVGPLGNICA